MEKNGVVNRVKGRTKVQQEKGTGSRVLVSSKEQVVQ